VAMCGSMLLSRHFGCMHSGPLVLELCHYKVSVPINIDGKTEVNNESLRHLLVSSLFMLSHNHA
jgi:hypothetical protein